MKDELIKFETAKLAKEKGFDVPCRNYFLWDERNGVWNFPLNANEMLLGDESNFNRPTQSLLQRWLREVHGIHIAIEFSNMQNAYFHKVYASTEDLIDIEMKYLTIEPENYIIYATYELAIESALFESLNLIP